MKTFDQSERDTRILYHGTVASIKVVSRLRPGPLTRQPLGSLRSPIFFLLDPVFCLLPPTAEPGPRLQPFGTEKVEYLGRPPVWFRKISVKPHVPFAFKPVVETEILIKWKAPLLCCPDGKKIYYDSYVLLTIAKK